MSVPPKSKLDLKKNVDLVRSRIHEACTKVGRAVDDVVLVAVTKTKSAALIEDAFGCGLKHFGENYVQEASAKIKELEKTIGKGPTWHFIGHLQSNKAKDVVGRFAFIHSVDRLSLAQTISKEAAKQNVQQRILVEVNLAGEKSKSGVSPEELSALVKELISLPHLQLEGLMAMPPITENSESNRKYFRSLCELGKELRGHCGSTTHPLRHLSMGTTSDYEVAIEEGATMVRLGTCLFGARE